MRTVIASVACITVGLGSSIAFASPADDAEKLAEAGDFIGAAGKFREAYAADPRPDLMCNVGVAYYKGKDFPHAFRFLEQCVSNGSSLAPEFLATVKQVVDLVDQKLRADAFTPIDITVEPATATTTVETAGKTEEPLVGSRRLWIGYGHYKLTMHAEGYADRVLEGDATGHEPIVARAKLEVKKADVVKIGPGPVGPVGEKPLPPSKTPAIIATTIAGTGLVAGVAMFLVARSRATDAGEQLELPAYNSKVSAAHAWQHGSWAAFGVGGVAAVAAGYLWYRTTKTPAIEVAPASGGATVSLGFDF